jgi:hypothetical protein
VPTWTPPVTLVANTNENVNDLNSIFTSLQNTVNGGLDEVNVPNLAAAFTHYKTVLWGGCQTTTAAAGGTFLMSGGPTTNAAATVGTVGAAGTAAWAFYLDPADWTANARTTRLRLRAQMVTNNVAPATNFAVGLYPVTTVGAASGSDAGVNTGAVITGSQATFVTPAAATAVSPVSSGDFNAPAAGYYIFAVAISAAMAAGSRATIGVQLQMRQV